MPAIIRGWNRNSSATACAACIFRLWTSGRSFATTPAPSSGCEQKSRRLPALLSGDVAEGRKAFGWTASFADGTGAAGDIECHFPPNRTPTTRRRTGQRGFRRSHPCKSVFILFFVVAYPFRVERIGTCSLL